jgi:hypothetical protein
VIAGVSEAELDPRAFDLSGERLPLAIILRSVHDRFHPDVHILAEEADPDPLLEIRRTIIPGDQRHVNIAPLPHSALGEGAEEDGSGNADPATVKPSHRFPDQAQDFF